MMATGEWDQYNFNPMEDNPDTVDHIDPPGTEWTDYNFNPSFDLEELLAGLTPEGDGVTTQGGPDNSSPLGLISKALSGSSGSASEIMKLFSGGELGKALLGGASLASILGPLFKDGYEGPVDGSGRPVKLTPFEKFIPRGKYSPYSLGYGTGSNTSKPLMHTLYGGQTVSVPAPVTNHPVDPPSTLPSPSTTIKGWRPGMQLSDLYSEIANRTGDAAGMDYWNKEFGSEIDANEYNTFKTSADQVMAQERARAPGYFKGGDVPRSDRVKGGLLPISAKLLEMLSLAGGQDDVVDIKAAPGEYIIDAEIVSALGDGNTDAGVRKLDGMRNSIRKHKRGGALSQIAPKALPIERYLGEK